MAKKGAMKYVPAVTLEYLENIKQTHNVNDADAFKLMAKDVRTVKEIEAMIKLDWSVTANLPKVEVKKKWKKQKGFF